MRIVRTLVIATMFLAPAAHGAKEKQQDRSARGTSGKTDRTKAKPGRTGDLTGGAGLRSGGGGGGTSDALGGLMDQLLMLQFGGRGNKQAHMFMEDAGRYGGARTAQLRLYSLPHGSRKFNTPKNDGSVIVMFRDNSGVYIHPDGLVTPMGDDISAEVQRYQEMP